MKSFLGAICFWPLFRGLVSTLVLSPLWGERSELSCSGIFSDLGVWRGFKVKAAECSREQRSDGENRAIRSEDDNAVGPQNETRHPRIQEAVNSRPRSRVSCKAVGHSNDMLAILPGTSPRCSPGECWLALTWTVNIYGALIMCQLPVAPHLRLTTTL